MKLASISFHKPNSLGYLLNPSQYQHCTWWCQVPVACCCAKPTEPQEMGPLPKICFWQFLSRLGLFLQPKTTHQKTYVSYLSQGILCTAAFSWLDLLDQTGTSNPHSSTSCPREGLSSLQPLCDWPSSFFAETLCSSQQHHTAAAQASPAPQPRTQQGDWAQLPTPKAASRATGRKVTGDWITKTSWNVTVLEAHTECSILPEKVLTLSPRSPPKRGRAASLNMTVLSSNSSFVQEGE